MDLYFLILEYTVFFNYPPPLSVFPHPPPIVVLVCFLISVVSLCSLSYRYVFLFTRALWHCEDMIQRYSRVLNNSSLSLSGAVLPHCSFSNVGKAVEDCMRAVIGVLLNLTHDNGTLI